VRPKPAQVKHFRCSTLGQAPGLALPTNIILGWKGWQGKNALAYIKNYKFINYDCKKFFIGFSPGTVILILKIIIDLHKIFLK
jgi:hypothetical protein